MAEKAVKRALEMTPLEYARLFTAQSIQIIILTFVISKIMLVVPLLVTLFKCHCNQSQSHTENTYNARMMI